MSPSSGADAKSPNGAPSRPTAEALPGDPLLGKTVGGRFKIRLVVGEGGMGKVYLAEDQRLNGRRVALKLMSAGLLEKPEFRSRFQREAVLQANLPHPQVIQVLDVGDSEEGAFIVMEYSDGRSLSTLIKELGARELDAALDLTEQLLEVLEFAHRQGVVHRDLKPSNILIEERPGREFLKILDFGIAKLISTDASGDTSQHLTRTGMAFGTLGYMAPEQARGDLASLDHRADIYSVGIILYELLTGKIPCPADHRTHPVRYAMWAANTSIAPLSTSHPELELPKALDPILAKALERDPKQRWSSALSFLSAVRELRRDHREQRRSKSRAFGTSAREVADAARSTRALQLSVGLLVVTAALGWVLWWQGRTSVSAPSETEAKWIADAQQLGAKLAEVQRARDALQSEQARVSSEHASITTELGARSAEVTALNEQLAAKQTDLTAAQAKIDELGREAESRDQRIAMLRSQLRSNGPEGLAREKFRKEKETLETEAADAKAELTRALSSLQEMKTAKEAVDAQLAVAEKARVEAENNLSGSRQGESARIAEIASRAASLEGQLRDEKSNRQRAEEALARAENQVRDLRSQLERPAATPVRIDPGPPSAESTISIRNDWTFQIKIEEILAVMDGVSARQLPLGPDYENLVSKTAVSTRLPPGTRRIAIKYRRWDRFKYKFTDVVTETIEITPGTSEVGVR